MTVRLGDVAPNFTAETTQGDIDLYEYMGAGWCVLFSHPRDFTPVCTTELGAMARLAPEFAARNTRVIGLSVDSADSHEVWLEDIEGTQGARVGFPIVADPDRTVAMRYGMIHPNEETTATVRSVFVIGPDKLVKLMLTYPQSTGRNFAEILRVLDSLQLTQAHKVATPADWTDGDDVIILPGLSDAEARERFPDGWDAPRPYIRMVPQPGRPGSR